MRRIWIGTLTAVCALLLAALQPALAQGPGDRYRIVVECPPFTGHAISLGHHFGKEVRPDASGTVGADGVHVFEGAPRLQGGLYQIAFPQDDIRMDVLIDTAQHFTVRITADARNELQLAFTGSSLNTKYLDYQRFVHLVDDDFMHLNNDLTNGASPDANIVSSILAQNRELKLRLYRRTRMAADPDGLLSALFAVMQEPDPEIAMDSLRTAQYMRRHYWDGVPLWDGRLVYTPYLPERMETYWTKRMAPDNDSVIACIDQVMGNALASPEMTELVLKRLLEATRTHQYPWADKVFLHLYDKYVTGRTYPWLTGEAMKQVNDHAYFLMGHTKGALAPELLVPSPSGGTSSLRGVKAKYTVLAFWDPACHHCVETLPRIDSLYRAEWKAKGVRVFAVAVESSLKQQDWKDYISRQHLEEWTHGYHVRSNGAPMPAGQTDACTDFDIWYFPTFFLLDADKHFMASKLSFEQMRDLVKTLPGK